MGGYALYVWSAYGLMAVLLVGNALVSSQRLKTALRRARKVPPTQKHA